MAEFSKKMDLPVSSRLDLLFRPGGSLFYGWWIVGIAALVQFQGALLWMQAYGAYTVLFQNEFGWSMTLLSGAFALTRIESGLLGPLQGWMVDRYGPRLILTIGLGMFGIGFLILTQVQTLLSYYLIVFLISVGVSLGGFHTLMVSIVNWFNRHRTKAVAFAQIGYSLGGLCVPIVAYGLEHQGWRFMSVVSGGMVLLLGIPLVQWIRHRPGEIGEEVDGGLPVSNRKEITVRTGTDQSSTWRQAVKTSSFWFISFGHGIALLTVSAVMVHLIPHLTFGLGLSLTNASIVFSSVGIFQMLGLLAGAYLGDRFNKRWICILCMISHGAGMLFLAYFEDFPLLIGFSMFHGLAWGIRGPQMVAIRADYFGPHSFGRIMGISSIIVMFGMIGGTMICGILFDLHGNYLLAFKIIAFCSIFGGLCFFFARKPDFKHSLLKPDSRRQQF